jgi:hypothetical protein
LNANRGVVAHSFTVRGDRGQQFAFICSWIGGYKERESVELKFTHPLAKFLLAFQKVDIRSLLATEFDLFKHRKQSQAERQGAEAKQARCLLIFCLLAGFPLFAQEKAPGESRNEEAMSSFQPVNASIDMILQEYEQLTGNALIKDSSLAANALPISISVPKPKPVPWSELVRIIESALLQNNYALIPGPEPKTVRVINMNTGKNPRSEALPLYTSPAWPSRR